MKFLEVIKDNLIENYKEYNAVNYSLLKEIFNENYKVIRDGLPTTISTFMDFGSYVDSTIENGKEPNVYTYNHVEVTSHSLLLVNELIKRKMFDTTEKERLEVANELDLWSSTKKEDLRLKNVNKPEIIAILNRERARNSGFSVISVEDRKLATQFLNVLKTHEFSKNIIDPPLKIETLKQVAIKFKFNGVECKVLIDILNIDHKEKIIWINDLKTGTPKNFIKNYYTYKYWIQGTFYTLAILYLKSKYKELAEYTIKPFTFLYLSRERQDTPLKYTMSKKTIERYTEGYITPNGDYRRGIIDLINEYKFHLETGRFDISKNEFDNNGEIILPEPN